MAGLPRSARLRSGADFAPLRNAPGRWQGRYFLLRWIALEHPAARMGMAVSRKVSKRAVIRNRIKRAVRESFRGRREMLPAVDILVIARTPSALATGSELRDELGRGWQRFETLKRSATPTTMGG